MISLKNIKAILKTAAVLLLAAVISLSAVSLPSKAESSYTGREDFVWGINIHNNGYVAYAQDPELYIRASAELGVNIIRINVSYTGNNFEYIDRVVEHCDRYGLEIMAVLPLADIETDEDAADISAFYEKFVSRYDGTKGKGFINYIQIGNEESIALLRNKYPTSEPDGSKFEHYYEEDLIAYQARYEAALTGLKNADTDIKSVINFSYYHYAPLQYAYENGLEFDIVGIDWYTNMPDISTVLERTEAVLPHDIIICESNLSNTSETDHEDVSEWDTLISYMDTCYADERVKGLIYYELMDEPAYEDEGTYNSESHYGFLYTGDSGSIAGYKPIYYKIQGLLGGGEITPLPEISHDIDDVLDLYGTSHSGRTLAQTSQWKFSYVTDWHSKNSAGIADFSDCETVEFDMQIGDYEAFCAAVEENSLLMWFRLSSDENRYNCNSAASYTVDELIPLGGEWYRVRIAKSRFTRNENGTIDWSNIKSWSFFFSGGTEALVSSLYSMPFSFRNICCTTAKPELPDNSVALIDAAGRENTVGSYFSYTMDRLVKFLESPVDLSDADYIEFDLEISDYETYTAELNAAGIVPRLWFSSAENRYNERSQVYLYEKYMTECTGKWYHYVIPKEDINVYNAADWSNITSWTYGLGGTKIAAGDAAGVNLKIINLCGTVRTLKSEVYTIADGYAFIDTPQSAVETVASNFFGTVKISGEGSAATGMTVSLHGNTGVLDSAVIAVKNDISCDGSVDSRDISMLRKALLGIEVLGESQKYALTQSQAADITVKELVAMKKAASKQ